MKATDIMDQFREVGKWVNWDRTCDQFLHGDPDCDVRGIATCWIPTNDAIRRAAQRDLNVFITHEPAFFHGYAESESGRALIAKKRALLDELGITLMRCHDTWDRMPGVGIPDAWAAWLGFETEARPVESYYKTCLLGDVTVEQAASLVLERVKPLGQPTVLIVGDRNKRVNRMAVGTGAVTHLPTMSELDPDLILATDDGMNFWDGALWATDLDLPLLIVNHSTAEKPGMMAMVRYLAERFPDAPVEYLDVALPYTNV